MKSFSLLHPRDQIVSMMERIYGHEMTTTSGGNISVWDENGENNGVMVAGRTVLDAFDRLEVLEATAAAIIRSRALGSISAMGPEVIQELLEAFPGL